MSSTARHANPPSAMTTRTSAPTSRHSASSHGAHVARSAGVGAFAGGAHRTAATIRVSLSANPSAASTHSDWLASPARCSAANRKSPDRSPVNTRPVRLAPCAAGARPTTITRGRDAPQPGHGPTPVRLARIRLALLDRDPLTPFDQPRAGPAHRHLGVELVDRLRRFGHGGHLRGSVGHRRRPRRRITRPASARGHRRVEPLAGAGMGQLHRSTVPAGQNRSPTGPGRC